MAHSRFSLANAAPENQECAHPAERVPPPPKKKHSKWIGAFPILARERRTGESRMRPSSWKGPPPPPTGKKRRVDWRIPDSRSRTPHRRIKNAPIQLRGSPPPPRKKRRSGLAHSRFSLANAAPENQEFVHLIEGVGGTGRQPLNNHGYNPLTRVISLRSVGYLARLTSHLLSARSPL